MPIAQNEYIVVSMEEQYSQESFEKLTIDQSKDYEFRFCKFDNVHFSNEPHITSLSYCEFRNCTFENFNGKNLDVKLANFYDCSFNSSDFSNANFSSSEIHYSKFVDTNLSDSGFVGATIKRSNFIRSELSKVDFSAVKIDTLYANDCIINAPVQGLYADNITMSGATRIEAEWHRNRLLDSLKVEPLKVPTPTQEEIDLVESYESIYKTPEAERVTEWFGDYGMNVIRPSITEGVFSERLNSILTEIGITQEQLNSGYFRSGKEMTEAVRDIYPNLSEINAAHLDNLKAIAEYEQELNVSPAERIVEMNYSTAHWQPKDGITPDQVEALYDHITNEHHIGFDEINRFRSDEGIPLISVDEYYQNQKNMAYVSRFDFDSSNSFNIESIKTALSEVPFEYVLSRMSQEQCDLFAEYYEANAGFAGAEEKRLYDTIINIRKNDLSVSHEPLESKVDPMIEMKPTQTEINNDFSKSIDDFINGKINPKEQIFVCPTTEVMKACGANNLDVMIYQNTIRKILSDDYSEFQNPHKLSTDTLKELPKQLEKPIMVFEGSHHGSIVMISDLVNQNNDQIIISCELDSGSRWNRINRVTSMYGKKNIANYLKTQINKGNLIGCQKNIANKMLHSVGLQLPSENTFIDYTDIISKAEANVNNKISPNITPGEQLSLFGAEAKKTPALETEKTTASKTLSKEEFDKLTSEMKDIAKTYAADPELFAEYMAFKAQFYQYSPTNAMLIHIQNPYATFVASYTKWKEMGYSIKKGEHHIKISRPIEISKFPKEINGKTVWTDVKYASPEEKAMIASGELEIRKTKKFIPHRVFDISQTNCPADHYPKIYNMGHPDIEQKQLYECVKEYAKISGFSVTEEDLSSISLHGYYSKTDDSIHINSLLEDSKRLETMCHELAHGILHKTSTQPVEISEFEAECFASMLKRKMGFPVSEESKRYISQYYNKIGEKNIGKFDMNKTLDRLSKAFNHTTKGIDETISNMGFAQEKELAHTLAQANGKAVDVSKISENFTHAL